jgi:hypothetical protein
MQKLKICWNCGSDDLEWLSKPISNSGVQDGSLKMNEIKTIYFLACHGCSETLQVMNENQALTLMNGAYFS